jgi:hypothetical protein
VQLRNTLKISTLSHILAAFQWVILVLSLAVDLNLAVFVTGAVANGGLKVIMLFNVWVLLFSSILFSLFFRIRKEGIVEKINASLSFLTILFSAANISLHFANDLILMMKATEVIAWTFYNSVFFVSVYKISNVLLFPALREDTEMKQEKHQDKKTMGIGS